MCFGVTSDHNEHTCLCLLRSLFVSLRQIVRVMLKRISSVNPDLLSHLVATGVRTLWCRGTIILEKRIVTIHSRFDALLHLVQLCTIVYIYTHIYIHNHTLSELIISIARPLARNGCRLTERYILLSLVTASCRFAEREREREQNFLHARGERAMCEILQRKKKKEKEA